jgi:uncharacterized membrane protein
VKRALAIRRLAVSGGLVAAAFAIKYPLIGLPNVEPFTLAFFCVGYMFGPLWGLFVGMVGETIYATINPYGASIPPVWASQIIGMGVAGLIGGWVGLMKNRLNWDRKWTLALVVGAGIVATLFFDLATNLATAWSAGPFWTKPFWTVMIAGIPLAGLHLASNALLFIVIFPILRRWLLGSASTVVSPSSF